MLDGQLKQTNSGSKVDSVSANTITRSSTTTTMKTTSRCSFYNRTMCSNGNCKEEEECKPNENSSNKSTLCYALWNFDGNKTNYELKGCWVGSIKECPGVNKCVNTHADPKKNLYYCCCNGDMCNLNTYHEPIAKGTIESLAPFSSSVSSVNTGSFPSSSTSLIFITLIPLTLLVVILFLAFWYFRFRKLTHFNAVSTREDYLNTSHRERVKRFPSKSINLIEVKATGRFGAVYKAYVGNNVNIVNGAAINGINMNGVKSLEKERLIAVKVFPQQDKASWAKEVEIYQLPKMNHENILTYLDAEERDAMSPFNVEYWLITEYHEYGSLTDYLKSHIISYEQLWKIVIGVANGLSFLHEPFSANKPAIAHRDFKSKNVLLKNDLTPCIADFGLAYIFYTGCNSYDALGQVGTRRYMAPEVLEGAISFTPDGLFRIDIYAYGLVVWELVTRYSGQVGPIGDYMLPFEEEVGSHPTLEDMQEIVCQQRKRPEIKTTWFNDVKLTILCETMKDCWDQDAEARLTASCVVERFSNCYC